MTITESMKHEIAAEMAHFEQKSAAGIEALKVVQREYGWIDDDALKEIASLLGMTPDELDSVATFYNLINRRPVGRHVIRLCTSVSCWLLGYETLLEHLQKKLGIELGQTTADGRFTLLPIQCLGTCDHAPALMINDDLHRDLSTDAIDAVLEQYT